MNQKKGGGITLSFTSPHFVLKKICHEVFAKQKKKLRAGLYYLLLLLRDANERKAPES
jgi:hypothetical protein